MTAFKKEFFHFDGMYLTYGEHKWGGPNGEPRAQFVARFKYRAAHLNILEKKGYVPFKNTPEGLLAQAAYKRIPVVEARAS